MTSPLRRLNLGCGRSPAPGWLNADREPYPGLDLQGDLCRGLPMESESFDWVVAIHLLQDLAWNEIPTALVEIRRLLKPGGVLRLAVPDMDRAIDACRRGDGDYFLVPDEDARSIGAKLVTQLIWYGSVRTPFNVDFAIECLTAAGFRDCIRCDFRQSRHADGAIAELDNRERESLFIEALR